MNEHKIKKKDWEEYLEHWKEIQHPMVPNKEAIDRYEKLIDKHVKGKKALLLGPTWQIRDLLAKKGFHVTAVDISEMIMKAHNKMCKVESRNEVLIIDNWLEFSPEEKFDLIIGDAANFQLKESSYDLFFSKVKSWLKPDGVSIQLIQGNHKNVSVTLQEVIDFLNNASEEELKDFKNRAFYYLAYVIHKNKDNFDNVAILEHDIQPFIEKDPVLKQKFELFSLRMNNFSAVLLPVDRIKNYIEKHLDILEIKPTGNDFVEESYYYHYVKKLKTKEEDKMKTIDITRKWNNTKPYPVDGLTKPGIGKVFDMEQGAPVNVSKIEYVQHFGTHVDAPAHVLKDGMKINSYPVDKFTGKAQVITVPSSGVVGVDDLKISENVEIVLFKSQNELSMEFDENHITLDPKVVDFAIEKGFSLIGLDVPSPDKFGAAMDNHLKLLENDVLIVENLDLSNVEEGVYTFVGVPLPVEAEASPIRAVLLKD